MTLLETILIIYILLSWFLTIMFITLPRRIINKVFFLFIIICPPLSIVYIGELIKEKTKKRKKTKEKENERCSSNQFQCKS